ncbi:MAG: quinolinate synthase NadA [Gammaproteobacteria bacterium]
MVATAIDLRSSALDRMCSTMLRIDPQHLARVLDNLVERTVVDRISVAPEVTDKARIALHRMLEICPASAGSRVREDTADGRRRTRL